MRSRTIILAVAVAALTLLSACAPVAKVLQSGSAVAGQAISAGGEPNTLNAQNYSPAQPVVGAPQAQSTVSPVRSITVTGEGRATLTPDMAYVNIGVHSENADVAEALATNKTQVQKVIDAIKGLGVADKDIQTTNFNVYPSQSYSPTGEITSTKYVVDNSVYVTVRNLNQLGDLLDKAVQSGANSINGIQFDVADKTSALSDARKAAVKNAQALATELAGAAGVEIGAVQSINEYSNNTPLPMYMDKGMGGGAMAPSAQTVPVNPGQMILTVNVNIVYELK